MEAKFLNAVLRTESKNSPHTGKPFTQDERWDHAIMSMVTEVGEIVDIFKKHTFYGKPLDRVHLMEECGDLLWYIGLGALTEGMIAISPCIRMEPVLRNEPWTPMLEALKSLSSAATREDAIVGVFKCTRSMIEWHDFDYNDVLDANIAKLEARYPEKFTTDCALNRE